MRCACSASIGVAREIDASAKITCRCWGDPDAESREILAGFGATYHQTAANAFVLNPRADKDSLV